MTIAEIKAELYDLRHHVCNGRLTIRPDGMLDPDDRPCSGCARTLVLHNMLRQQLAQHGGVIQ